MKHYKERIAQGVAGRIIRFQLTLSRWLGRKTQHWNKTSKVIALLLFCLLFGGASLWLLLMNY